MTMSEETGVHLLANFRKDEDGATMFTFALSVTILLACISAGMDIGLANQSKAKAQSVADAVALNAAVFVRDNNRAPLAQEDGFQDGIVYKASDIGIDFGGRIDGDVTIQVDYDMVSGDVTTTVEGKTKTTFSQFIGQDTVKFSSVATAKFLEKQDPNPASIVFVADNSGSMQWHDESLIQESDGSWTIPTDSESRISALEEATKGFMTTLSNLVGPQGNSQAGSRILRTGLLPFDDDIISLRTVQMDWDVLSTGEIESMTPSGATNSSPPMAQAKLWLDAEAAYHQAETGFSPLRYAIFLTDGVNTTGGYTWNADSDTDYWRKYVCGTHYCYYQHYTSTYDLTSYGYEEGEYTSDADTETSTTCTAMKNAGYRVFSIGFALQPGYYYDGTGNKNSWSNYEEITSDDSTRAYALLSGCASNPEDFVAADDADDLDAAFTMISNTIVDEIIRLSG